MRGFHVDFTFSPPQTVYTKVINAVKKPSDWPRIRINMNSENNSGVLISRRAADVEKCFSFMCINIVCHHLEVFWRCFLAMQIVILIIYLKNVRNSDWLSAVHSVLSQCKFVLSRFGGRKTFIGKTNMAAKPRQTQRSFR